MFFTFEQTRPWVTDFVYFISFISIKYMIVCKLTQENMIKCGFIVIYSKLID